MEYSNDWDKFWCNMLPEFANKSKDTKTKVGCLITYSDNSNIVSFGYNGDHVGGTNERLSQETGKS